MWLRHMSRSLSKNVETFHQRLCAYFDWCWQERTRGGWAADATGGNIFLAETSPLDISLEAAAHLEPSASCHSDRPGMDRARCCPAYSLCL